MIACQVAALFAFGAYRGMWRYFGLMDAVIVAKSVAVGTLTVAVCMTALNGGLRVPGAVYIIYAALLMLMLTASRASFRLMSEFVSRTASGRRAVIFAAGPDEQLLVHRIARNSRDQRRVLGFFEVTVEGARVSVHGYPLMGDYEALLQLIAAGLTDDVIACVQNIEPGLLAELEQHCRVHGSIWFALRMHWSPPP